MRYRALDVDGDYTFGQGQANFLINSPEAVAQAVKTRLLLMSGEWFLDSSEGTPYSTQILGKGTVPLYDQAIQQRILGTEGVTGIVAYDSTLDTVNRALSVNVTITTEFSEQPVSVPLVTLT